MAEKRDTNADAARLVDVLRAHPDRVFLNAGEGELSHLACVPKNFVRGLLEGHPNVTVGKQRAKYTFQFRPTPADTV